MLARQEPFDGLTGMALCDEVESLGSDACFESTEEAHEPVEGSLADLVAASGLRRVHILAWRDLEDPEAGGSEVHAANIAKLWGEAGLEVTMRTSAAQGAAEDAMRDGYRVIRKGGRYSVFGSGIAAELLGRHGPSEGLLEVWNGVPWFSPLWSRVPRAVMIHHVHHDMWHLVLEKWQAKVGKTVETKIAPLAYRSTNIVTPSWSTRDEVVGILGMDESRVSVAPPGVDGKFHPGSEALSPVPLIVCVGRLMPPKRVDEMIRIANEVRQRHPELQLVIVGHGYERPKLEQVISELDAQDWVRLAGFVSDEDLVSLYRRAWVVSSASMAEGWGMSLTEAAACGTPAVATNITGHRDSVVDNETGLLASSSREMVDKLDAVIANREMQVRLAENARKRAAKWTWEACAYGTFLPLAQAAMSRQGRNAR